MGQSTDPAAKKTTPPATTAAMTRSTVTISVVRRCAAGGVNVDTTTPMARSAIRAIVDRTAGITRASEEQFATPAAQFTDLPAKSHTAPMATTVIRKYRKTSAEKSA